jgi:hypothetical protein
VPGPPSPGPGGAAAAVAGPAPARRRPRGLSQPCLRPTQRQPGQRRPLWDPSAATTRREARSTRASHIARETTIAPGSS